MRGVVVKPVPPFAVLSVPERTTGPAVGDEGERPVVPAENVATPAVPVALIVIAPAALVIVTPEPAVSVLSVKPEPLPIRIWPFVAALASIPVPPFAGSKIPPSVTAPVPAPEGVRPVAPPDQEETETPDSDCHVASVPFDVRT